MLTCKIVEPGENLDDARAVRTPVFVEEQKFSVENEYDSIDPTCHHVVLYRDTLPIATGRLFPCAQDPTSFTVGRIAVLREHRGGGIGKILMEHLEQQCRGLGARRITLGAQCQATAFYESCGYTQYGEQYMDEHCPHINMEKFL